MLGHGGLVAVGGVDPEQCSGQRDRLLAAAVGVDGRLYGTSQNASGIARGFVWNNGTLTDLGSIAPGDAVNVSYAAEVLRYFKPKFLTLNMGGVDSCHSNFTSYLRSLHRAD